MKYARLALVVVMFAGVGVYLLATSRAATETASGDILSLMPAAISVHQGEIVNVAINVQPAQLANDVKAVVSYPADGLELQAVQGVCQEAGLQKVDSGEQHSVADNTGTVTVSCKSDEGLHRKTTVGIMVFKALTNGGDAQLSISDGTIASSHANGTNLLVGDGASEEKVTSRISLKPTVAQIQAQPKVKRPVPQYKSKSLCNPVTRLKTACSIQQLVNDDGTPLRGAPPTGAEVTGAATEVGYGPAEFHTAYQLPCRPGGPVASVCAQPSTFGPENIVIVGLGGYVGGADALEADLTFFSQYFGIPTCTRANSCLKVVNASGQTSPMPVEADDWTVELAMDVDAAHGICQTCKITVVLADSNNYADAFTATSYAASLKPVAVSGSWYAGNSLYVPTAADEAAFNQPGVPLVIITGDTGEDLKNTDAVPGEMANGVSVAGTTLQLNTDKTWASETVWAESGGSCSSRYEAPSWQKALPNWSSVGCGNKRAFGDVALDADPNTGIWNYAFDSWAVSGGTSMSAPLMAGIYGVAGQGVTPSTAHAPSVLYAKANSTNTHDVTSGNNCVTGGKGICTAKPGFDVPTGLGSLIGTTAVGGPPTPPPTTPPPTTPPPTTPPPTTPPPTTPPPTTPPPTPPGKTGDLNSDNKINLTDLSILLSAWNTANATADINKSGKVDITDLSILLSNWGK